MFFFAPFIWMLAVPVLFVGILLIRLVLSLRSLGRSSHSKPESGPFIEGEFIDDEKPDNPEDGSGSSRDPLEK